MTPSKRAGPTAVVILFDDVIEAEIVSDHTRDPT